MRFVLDACAMIAFLRKEPGGPAVAELLGAQPPSCLAHAVNLCEVFYCIMRAEGEPAARAAVGDLRALGLLVREDMDEAFWQQVGRFKVASKMALGDAFAVALADRFAAEVVTTDHGEFDPVARRGICRVRFVR